MIDFSSLTKAIFEKKHLYYNIDEKDKEMLFFPLNRYMGRALPHNAEALNKNGIDGALAMDIWFNYAQRTTLTPDWYYPRVKKSKQEKSYLDSMKDIDDIDKYILENFYQKEIDYKIEREKEIEKNIVTKKLKRKKK